MPLGNRAVGKLGAILGFAVIVLFLVLLFALAILNPITFVAILLILGGLALIAFRPAQWYVGLIVLGLGLVAALIAGATGGLVLNTANPHFIGGH